MSSSSKPTSSFVVSPYQPQTNQKRIGGDKMVKEEGEEGEEHYTFIMINIIKCIGTIEALSKTS